MAKLITVLHTIPLETFQKIAFRKTVKDQVPEAVIYCLVALYAGLAAIKLGLYMFIGIPICACLLTAVFLSYRSSRSKQQIVLNNGVFNRRRLWEIDETGFLIRYETGSYQFIVWEDIAGAEHRDECIYIFPSKMLILQVPDIAWPSFRERDEFLSLLRSKSFIK